jgi:hypothetical protein
MCEYAGAFGEPETGAHAWSVGPGGGVAAVDLGLTAAAALLLGGGGAGGVVAFILLVAAGVVAHWVFCVDTRLNRWLAAGWPKRAGPGPSPRAGR